MLLTSKMRHNSVNECIYFIARNMRGGGGIFFKDIYFLDVVLVNMDSGYNL
jgi:hypothetical protein